MVFRFTKRAVAGLLLLAALLFSGTAGVDAAAEAVKDLPQPTDYISDFAGVLSPQTKLSLSRLCGQVDRQAHAQIAVVTIKSLDGESVEDYSVQLWDKWKIGQKDRGVLVLLAVQDRQRWITTGYGLESILPDSRVGDIGRQMVPYLRAGDYDDAVTVAVSQMAQIIAKDAGVTLQPMQRRGPPPQAQIVRLSLGQIILFGIVILLVIVFLARAGGSGLIGFLLGMFLGGGGRGGGGWGGGDGGGDDGGGFGGFGGGSTGGGGAGGSW